jgi:hypothetical protein
MSKSIITKTDSSLLLSDSVDAAPNFTADDIMVPRLSILQQMSPQINKRDGSYVEGAEPGFIYDNVSMSVVDGAIGITVVPVTYRRAFIQWKRDRGGFVADLEDASCLDDCTRGERGEYFTPDGDEIVVTATYVILVLADDGSFSPALLSMAKSQIKKSRQWNSIMHRLKISVDGDGKTITPAMFYDAYQLSSVEESNDQGSWFGWSVRSLYGSTGGILKNLPNGEEIYLAARAFKSQTNIKVSPEDSI